MGLKSLGYTHSPHAVMRLSELPTSRRGNFIYVPHYYLCDTTMPCCGAQLDTGDEKSTESYSENALQALDGIASGMLIEVDGSVVKRTDEPTDIVRNELSNEGFEHTNSSLTGRVHYYENDKGTNLTVIRSLRGTIVVPTGPVRSKVYGK